MLLARAGGAALLREVRVGAPGQRPTEAYSVGLHAGEGFEAHLNVTPANVAVVALVVGSSHAEVLTGLEQAAPAPAYGEACTAPASARFELAPAAAVDGAQPLRERVGAPARLGAAMSRDAAALDAPWRLSFRAPSRDMYRVLLLRCGSVGAGPSWANVSIALLPLCAEPPAAVAALADARRAAAAAAAANGGEAAAGGAGATRRRGRGLLIADEAELSLYACLLALVICALCRWALRLMQLALAARGGSACRPRAVHALLLPALVLKALEYTLRIARIAELGTAPPLLPSGWLNAEGVARLGAAAAAASTAAAARAHLVAKLCGLLASLALLATLLVVSSGLSIVRASLSQREHEAIGFFTLLYGALGALSATCSRHDGAGAGLADHGAGASASFVCDVYELTFQVVRFVCVFGAIVSLNSTVERLRVCAAWNSTVRCVDIGRLAFLRSLRWATLVVHLVMPIVLLFLEVRLLSWHSSWLQVLWPESLMLAMLGFLTHTLAPTDYAYRHLFLEAAEADANVETGGGTRRAAPAAAAAAGPDAGGSALRPRAADAGLLHLPEPTERPLAHSSPGVRAGLLALGSAHRRLFGPPAMARARNADPPARPAGGGADRAGDAGSSSARARLRRTAGLAGRARTQRGGLRPVAVELTAAASGSAREPPSTHPPARAEAPLDGGAQGASAREPPLA
ncbi:hypothetical protein KFE25_011771 [Diacronema lutheri]|uniref:Uncharacterized protein n=1 Tax=Diacronema lutheri TaxID=2081491 RepID=A0A8J6C817_DIALT|nr:hypothetical protein KFE25_011771 [Diacronema lutheri]